MLLSVNLLLEGTTLTRLARFPLFEPSEFLFMTEGLLVGLSGSSEDEFEVLFFECD